MKVVTLRVKKYRSQNLKNLKERVEEDRRIEEYYTMLAWSREYETAIRDAYEDQHT